MVQDRIIERKQKKKNQKKKEKKSRHITGNIYKQTGKEQRKPNSTNAVGGGD